MSQRLYTFRGYSPSKGWADVPLAELVAHPALLQALDTVQLTGLLKKIRDTIAGGADVGVTTTRGVVNPTLVSHRLAQTAIWHILEHQQTGNVPLADLYWPLASPRYAASVARHIATMLRRSVVLLDNRQQPARLRDHPGAALEPRNVPRGRKRKQKGRNPRGPRIVYNKLLGGWYVVVGPHQAPLNGRFNSKAEARAWLAGQPGARGNPARSPAARARRREFRSGLNRKVRRAAARAIRRPVGPGNAAPPLHYLASSRRRLAARGNPAEPICYGQSIGRDWAQEWYETASRHAGIRARQLRAAGYKAVAQSMGSQVTGVGTVKMTLLTISGGDLTNLPPVRVERISNPCRGANPKGRNKATVARETARIRESADRLSAFHAAERRFEEWVSTAADTWSSTANRLAMSGLFPPFYLYFRPSTATQDGALYMVPEATEPDPLWQLGDPEAFRSNLTRDQVRARIWKAARRLPLHKFGPEGNPTDTEKFSGHYAPNRIVSAQARGYFAEWKSSATADRKRFVASLVRILREAQPGSDRQAAAMALTLIRSAGRARNPEGRVRNAAGESKTIWDGKYLLEEGEPQTHKHLGHVRLFTATGRRSAVYGCMVYPDGRWHWINAGRTGGSVPFDLAQINPASYFDAPAGNPSRGKGARERRRARVPLQIGGRRLAKAYRKGDKARASYTLKASAARKAKRANILWNPTPNPKGRNPRLQVLPGARLHDWTPQHPERTSYRNHGGTDFDITVKEWPSAGAMKTALEMQGRRASRFDDWRPWPARRAANPKGRKSPEPSLYISQSSNEAGDAVYRVIYQGMPVMTDTSDPGTARTVLKETAAKLGVPVPSVVWDGDLGRFITPNPKGRKSDSKFIAWVHHSSIAVGPTVEAVVERARALVHSARWQKFEPGYPDIYVTTYGTQKMVQQGISSAEPPKGPVANPGGMIAKGTRVYVRVGGSDLYPLMYRPPAGVMGTVVYVYGRRDTLKVRWDNGKVAEIPVDAVETENPRRTRNPKGRSAANPRAPFQPGEWVSVPYTGRSSYFGRAVKRTHEKGVFLGYDADGSVHVQVRRGRTTEDHHFAPAAVRRLPQRGPRALRSRADATKARLVLKSQRAQRKAALEAAAAARREQECVKAKAEVIQVQTGNNDSPDYKRLRSRWTQLENIIGAQEAIAADLERQDPSFADPWADPAMGGAPDPATVRTANPSDSQAMSKAERTFRMWQDRDDVTLHRKKMRRPDPLPAVAAELGKLVAVVYDSDKFDGKRKHYEHTFDHPRPSLVTDPEARGLHIVGGNYSITADGIKH